MKPILFFFFLSGFPALIYQIIWQRALFAIFGSNIEAVTLVVSSFMLGLGIGSLAGGRLSSSDRTRPLLLFGLFELLIGAFGLLSLTLIDAVGTLTVGIGPAGTFVVSFMLVLLPTFLMGATLPLLVTFLVRRSGAVGLSVSLLYSVNTWGSAVACFVGAFLVFGLLGMHGSVVLASTINILIGLAAVGVALRDPESKAHAAQATDKEPDAKGLTRPFGMFAATLLVGASGFISLSYEILWTRVFYLEFAGRAFAFPIVLGLFLAGIAIGSSIVRSRMAWFRAAVAEHGLLPLAALLLVANIIGFLVIPALVSFGSASRGLSALFMVISAAGFGALLPIVSDLCIAAGRTSGQRVSQLYVANIVGSTLGTIVTGLFLLDTMPLPMVSTSLLIAGFFVCGVLVCATPAKSLRIAASGVAAIVVVPAVWFLAPTLHAGLYETLQFRNDKPRGYRFDSVAETKSGVVTVADDRTVYGTGVYDGIAEIDLMNDRNGLFRVTALAAVHPEPKSVLVIGLSSAAWTQILANLPGVETVTAVEINPGYLSVISEYPDVQSVLTNPKIDIMIDDGRRWLRRNPERKFDLIVANTTFHWRAGASNLLSVEFLDLVRRHLQPGGIYYYNTTSSNAVQKTGASVFPHAARFEHFLMTSDDPIVFDQERWHNALSSMSVDGQKLFDLSRPEHRQRIEIITSLADRVGPVNPENELEFAVEFRDSILERTAGERLITDDNMGSEWPVPAFDTRDRSFVGSHSRAPSFQ